MSKTIYACLIFLITILLSGCTTTNKSVDKSNEELFDTWALSIFNETEKLFIIDGFSTKLECMERGYEINKEKGTHYNCGYQCITHQEYGDTPVCDIVCDSRDGCRD